MSHSVVIGGAGFVGSWIVDEILKNPEAKVTVVDNLLSSERWNISRDPRVIFIEGSASELSTFMNIESPVQYIYQLACFHGNQSSIARPLDDLENGLKTTLVTLEWMKLNHPNARLIYSGAGCALAEKTWDSPLPVGEIDNVGLLQDSPYSISKISGEMYCLYYAKQFNLDIVRVRFQNIYGPREILGAGQWRGTINTVWRNVVPTLIYKALKNDDIQIYGSNPSRDFTYVGDVSRLVVELASSGKTAEVYNIASEEEVFISDLASKIIQMTNSNSKVLNEEKRHWDNSGRRIGGNQKLAEFLNLKPTVPLDVGLAATIKWTRKNLVEIEKSISKFVDLL